MIFTATVTGDGVTPTGAVTFLDGATNLGPGTLNSTGVATCATTTLAAGKHSIAAACAGNGNYLVKTSAAVTITVSSQ